MSRNSIVDNLDRSDYHSEGLGGEKTAEPNELLTTEEVCDLLEVSKGYIYRLTHRQSVPFIRVQGCPRFGRSDVAVAKRANKEGDVWFAGVCFPNGKRHGKTFGERPLELRVQLDYVFTYRGHRIKHGENGKL